MRTRYSSWILPMATGAAAMYLLDPDGGARRRALVRDKMVWASRKTRDGLAALGCDLQNRAIGALSEIRSRFDDRPVDDSVLEARVRSALGRATMHPGAINVMASDGRVILTGPILAHEHDRVYRTVAWVRGANEVIDSLVPHESADSVPALQGEGSLPSDRWMTGWSPTAQAFCALASLGLIAAGRFALRRTTLSA